MHILFVSPAYPPFPGGGERYAHALAAELVRRGHRLTAVTSQASHEQAFWRGSQQRQPTTDQLDGVQIIRCPLRPLPAGRPSLLVWRKAMVLLSAVPGVPTAVLRYMARFVPPIHGMQAALADLPPVDLVHGFNSSWEHALLAGRRFAQQRGLPFVATPFAHFGTGNDRVARNSTMKHQLQLLQNSDRVLVLTAVEQAALAQWGIPPQKIGVISGGVDPLPPFPDTAVTQAQHQLPSPYLLFVGRASYEKGAIHAAQAILTLRQQGTAVTLALVGQSSPEFTQFYQQLSADEQAVIRPLGVLDEASKQSMLAGTVALLLPSRTDSFGLVLLEAWQHGKPVIAADAGGIPGVVDHGQNGLLLPFAQPAAIATAVQTLLNDADLARRLGANGRAKVESQYNWTAVADRTLAHYQALLP